MSETRSGLAGERGYVVFLPGTFRLLRWCLFSLLEYTPLTWTVVGNGLDSAEEQLVAALCAAHGRLRYIGLGPDLLPHGTALNRVFNQHEGECFTFCDSDVAALAPLADWLGEKASAADVFSSCTIAKNPQNLVRRGFGGQATESPSGRSLAASYFAIYRSEPARAIMEKYGISFDRMAPGRLPEAVRKVLEPADISDQNYDTGKLLSLLACYAGLQVAHENHPDLLHLGGMSKDFSGGDQSRQMRRNHQLIQQYFSEVLAGKSAAPPELDQDWKTKNVLETGDRMRGLIQQMTARYPDLTKLSEDVQ